MKVEIEQNSLLQEKLGELYFSLEELFYEFVEIKKFELTPQVVRRLYNILSLYNDIKTELANAYKIDLQKEDSKYDPLTPIFNLIIEAITLVQSLYYNLLNNNVIDIETLSVLKNIMSRIQRTILFFHYFNFVI